MNVGLVNRREGSMKRSVTNRRRLASIGIVVLVAALATVAAGSGAVAAKGVPAAQQSTAAGPLVALLWPENVTPRWEGSDRPILTKTLKKLVPGVQVDSPERAQRPGEAAGAGRGRAREGRQGARRRGSRPEGRSP